MPIPHGSRSNSFRFQPPDSDARWFLLQPCHLLAVRIPCPRLLRTPKFNPSQAAKLRAVVVVETLGGTVDDRPTSKPFQASWTLTSLRVRIVCPWQCMHLTGVSSQASSKSFSSLLVTMGFRKILGTKVNHRHGVSSVIGWSSFSLCPCLHSGTSSSFFACVSIRETPCRNPAIDICNTELLYVG